MSEPPNATDYRILELEREVRELARPRRWPDERLDDMRHELDALRELPVAVAKVGVELSNVATAVTELRSTFRWLIATFVAAAGVLVAVFT